GSGPRAGAARTAREPARRSPRRTAARGGRRARDRAAARLGRRRPAPGSGGPRGGCGHLCAGAAGRHAGPRRDRSGPPGRSGRGARAGVTRRRAAARAPPARRPPPARRAAVGAADRPSGGCGRRPRRQPRAASAGRHL
ncbi:MAG: hypothetical protein AVDCRST_MAG07-1355, partial [uncultured Frankineae bacterium]